MKKLSILFLSTFFLFSCNQEKTAFVDSVKLLKDYKETQDIQKKFENKSDSLRAGFDALSQNFQRDVQDYQSKMGQMSAKVKEETEKNLIGRQQQIQQMQQVEGQRFQQESQASMDSLLSKVKKFVSQYGKDNGYSYIFGSNETQNILYGSEKNDITATVLEALNKAYEAKK